MTTYQMITGLLAISALSMVASLVLKLLTILSVIRKFVFRAALVTGVGGAAAGGVTLPEGAMGTAVSAISSAILGRDNGDQQAQTERKNQHE